jgi:protein gp37
MAARFCGPGQPYEGLIRRSPQGARWSGESMFLPEKLVTPLRWQRPRLVFVNSMSDLFFEGFTDEQVAAVFGAMAGAPQHTFQVLTKRPARMLEWAERYMGEDAWWVFDELRHESEEAWERAEAESDGARAAHDLGWLPPNVWMGVSVEGQDVAARLDHLVQVPAAVRFVSAEPLIGPLDLSAWMPRLDWVIAGGESGPGARALEVDWVRSIVETCAEHSTDCFVKQMGSVWAREQGMESHKGEDPEEWDEDLRVQQTPAAVSLSELMERATGRDEA